MVDYHHATTLVPRQIFATPTRTSSSITRVANTLTTDSAASIAQSSLCTVGLPAGGILRYNDSYSEILQYNIPFESPCDDPLNSGSDSGSSTVIKFSDPFYSSVAPQIYALATATVISYILVILIFITPRTFYVGGPGGGANFLGLRSLVPGAGSSNIIGVGRRPLLQKIAAVTVVISLTIATADTFAVAERQYKDGLMDSQALVEEVIGSTEIRVVRVVSDTFLWLAQVQTLIRLFPRHKEKVTIKWLGFALVTCDTVFSILENFVSETTLTRPRSFQDAIPALGYLFQMSISLIYASCVIYYSLSKRRFAFYHSKMKNIFLVALLGLASVLIPVVFFVLDVSQPKIATWGEYIRWVGAAAASVVVWEWVERIEALERDERKDGILGREIFDGDEMLEMNSDDSHGRGSSTYFGFGKRHDSGVDSKKVSMFPLPSFHSRIPFKKKKDPEDNQGDRKQERRKSQRHRESEATVTGEIARPPQVASPVSRSDTTSASTVYAVRYQNVQSMSPAIPEESEVQQQSRQPSLQVNDQTIALRAVVTGDSTSHNNQTSDPILMANTDTQSTQTQVQPQVSEQPLTRTQPQLQARDRQAWSAVANPFKRKRAEPPAEVAAQMTASNVRRSPAQTYHNLRDRFQAYRATQRSVRGKPSGPSPPVPITVIPAQPRPARLTVPDETPRTSARPSQDESLGLRARRSANSKNPSSKASRENLPVTVIPAPARGARTWSPDDLNNKGSGSQSSEDRRHSQGQNDEPHDGNVEPPGSPTTGTSAPKTSTPENRSTTYPIRTGTSSPTQTTSASRFRTPPIDSLNERLGSSPTPSSHKPRQPNPTTESKPSSSNSQRRPLLDASVTPSASGAIGSQTKRTPPNQPEVIREPPLPSTEAQDTPPPVNIRAGHSKV